MKNKRFILMVLAIFLVTTMIFAQAAEESIPTADKPVKLQVWYALSGASGENFVAIAEAFQQDHPEIELELTYSGKYADTATKVSAAMLSGTNPDIAIMAAGQLYTGGRGNFDMETLAKNDSDFNLADIYPGILDYAKYDEKVASLPFGISTQVMYYNKKIMQKAGIDLSNPPKTWQEFLEVAKLAVEKGNINNSEDFYGFDTSDNVWLIKSMLAQNGNAVVKKEGNMVVPVFNETSGIEVAEFWKSLCSEKVMPEGQHSNAEKKFLAGNLAFVAASSNRISRWGADSEFEFGAIPMPYFKKPAIFIGGNGVVIFTQEELKKNASWKFVKCILTEETQTSFALDTGYLPVRKSSRENPVLIKIMADNPKYKVAIDQLDYSCAYLHFSEMGTMDGYLWYALDEIEKGVSSPKKAFDDAASGLLKEME